jgi:hypothetical protein
MKKVLEWLYVKVDYQFGRALPGERASFERKTLFGERRINFLHAYSHIGNTGRACQLRRL